MRKLLGLSLLFILTACLPIDASSATTVPSVPEFTIKLVRHSLNQPEISSIDPYTGENVTIAPAKHDEWTSIVVTITNQQFTPYRDSSGNLVELYYNVRSKGHFSEIWIERYNAEAGYPNPSNSDYTTLDYAVDYPDNAQVDFQVQAFIGYNTKITDAWTSYGEEYHYVFTGESSGWSNTQAITIGDGSVVTVQPTPSLPSSNPSASPIASPSVTPMQLNTDNEVLFGLDWWQVVYIVLGVVCVLLVFVVFYLRKRK